MECSGSIANGSMASGGQDELRFCKRTVRWFIVLIFLNDFHAQQIHFWENHWGSVKNFEWDTHWYSISCKLALFWHYRPRNSAKIKRGWYWFKHTYCSAPPVIAVRTLSNHHRYNWQYRLLFLALKCSSLWHSSPYRIPVFTAGLDPKAFESIASQ